MKRFALENPKLTAKNPHFGNRYAPLDEVLRVIQPVFDAGYDIRQTCWVEAPGHILFVTELSDEQGKAVKSVSFPFVGATDPQKTGSAITYARRYGLLLLFNLVGEEDDDAEAAHGRGKTSKPKASKPKATKSAAPKAPAVNTDDW